MMSSDVRFFIGGKYCLDWRISERQYRQTRRWTWILRLWRKHYRCAFPKGYDPVRAATSTDGFELSFSNLIPSYFLVFVLFPLFFRLSFTQVWWRSCEEFSSSNRNVDEGEGDFLPSFFPPQFVLPISLLGLCNSKEEILTFCSSGRVFPWEDHCALCHPNRSLSRTMRR